MNDQTPFFSSSSSSTLPFSAPSVESSIGGVRAYNGVFLWALMTDPAGWIHRRVESVHLADQSTVRRSVSFDFTVRFEGADELPIDRVDTPIPLTLLNKGALREFDLRSSDNRPIPMLTKAQNSRLVSDAIVATAETILNAPLVGEFAEVAAQIEAIVDSDATAANATFSECLAIADPTSDHACHDAWSQLKTIEPGFLGFLELVANQFVLLADMEVVYGERSIVKMAYDETLSERNEQSVADKPETTVSIGALKRARDFVRDEWDSMKESTGWRFRVLRFDAPAVGLAQSFHFEFRTPHDLVTSGATLRFEKPDSELPSAGSPAPDDIEDLPKGATAHLYCSDVTSEYVGRVRVFLRPQSAGVPRAAFFITGLVLVLVAAFFAREFSPGEEINDPQTAGTLLLIAPSLFAAFAIRPGEHGLASELMIGVRILLLIAVCTAISASVVMSSGIDGGLQIGVWRACLVIAGLVLVLLARPGASPIRNPESDERWNDR